MVDITKVWSGLLDEPEKTLYLQTFNQNPSHPSTISILLLCTLTFTHTLLPLPTLPQAYLKTLLGYSPWVILYNSLWTMPIV